jgi:hypothetical protein
LWFLPHEKQQNAASTKRAAPSLFLVGPTTIKHFFLLNQTVLCVVAGEPHPQPRYQTGTNNGKPATTENFKTLMEYSVAINTIIILV